jgi:hypothetical protein
MKQLTYSGIDRKDKGVYAFIARDEKLQQFMCHVFQCEITVCENYCVIDYLLIFECKK